MDRTTETKGRVLQSVKIGKYTLLNSEKLGRVLDMLEGIAEKLTAGDTAIINKCKSLEHDQAVLSLYDRTGGAIKLGDRKVAIGTFYDFAAREPKIADVSEDDFADEYVLVRKKAKKAVKNEKVGDRMKRLDKKTKKVENSPTKEGNAKDGEKPKDDKPKKDAKKPKGGASSNA